MSSNSDSEPKIARRLFKGRFLYISIALHVLLAIVAGYLIVQTIQPRKQTFKAGAPSPNPSARALEHQVQMANKKKTMSAPQQAKRIASTAPSKISLPEMPMLPNEESVTPNRMAGMGGSGTGLGAGGVGGASGLAGGPMPFFGLRQTAGGSLTGNFYDLKQDRNGRPTDMAIVDQDWRSKAEDPANASYYEALSKFCRSGWNEVHLNKFFKGPAPLYSTQLFIPTLAAEKGPEAFNLADKVSPRRWAIHYQGKVIPPVSGRYRFVGFGDDVLAVKFNGRVVLDCGFQNPANNKPVEKWYAAEGLDVKPAEGYGGLGIGLTFDVKAGNAYNMDILTGECPGGFYRAYLLLEKIDETYTKDTKGNPILPIFKLAPSAPPARQGEAPLASEDKAWSVWKAESPAAASSPFRKPF